MLVAELDGGRPATKKGQRGDDDDGGRKARGKGGTFYY